MRKQEARVIGLTGTLGSGKTTLIQGFFREMGVARKATSPTFIIVRRTPIKRKKFKNIFHVDAYRLRRPRDIRLLHSGNILSDPRNVVLIEWAEKVRAILPKRTQWLYLKHGRKENERSIHFYA
jgi:tRNA threonylcarbamoyladenosine biosynthesis protein TsaE